MTPRMTWLVTESAYGKTTGTRRHDRLDDAVATAGKWVAQSVGDVVISRREVSI